MNTLAAVKGVRMAIGIGVDIGTISIKLAVIGGPEDTAALDRLAGTDGFFRSTTPASGDPSPIFSTYRRIRGRPLDTLAELLDKVRASLGGSPARMMVTGSGARLAAAAHNVPALNEFAAIAEAASILVPDAGTIFEMGGETSKFILLGRGAEGFTIRDYGTNGDCAAGTGSFMDQQATRLQFNIEDIGDIVAGAKKTAQIAGRCSVFAKSDMIHAQQRGYQPDEVLKGLCNAVARNFKGAIVRSRKVEPPIVFIGGLALNKGMIQALADVFEIDRDLIRVPEAACWFGALGAAIRARRTEQDAGAKSAQPPDTAARAPRLSLENVSLLREREIPFVMPEGGDPIPAWLGIDIGSVSTNLVVVDDSGAVITEIYTRTLARPIEVVGEGLLEIRRRVGDRVDICGVGTTGSGRELIGILVGADTIRDEITAHKTGALHISHGMLDSDVDTIFEIGGQDAKFISIEDGIVVDFTMNDACAAGTGSFLEEQAEELDIAIVNEFAERALASERPLRMGERCTVFMGRDVKSHIQRGAAKEDIVAGLAYSVVHNYLNRVVRDRRIGDTIFFQGGTAYNDAVAAAFAGITGKEIIVPPHNGVIGAIGVALLARDLMQGTDRASTFHGWDLSAVDYSLREFSCKGCSNFCTIQEFTVSGEKTYWGDKCSDRYRKRKKIARVPVVEDLYHTYESLLLNTYAENGSRGVVVGIPRAIYTYDRMPFFNTWLTGCGFRTVLSDPTNTEIANEGIDAVVAEPCYPIIVAHGHIASLLNKGVDRVFLPNIIDAEQPPEDDRTHNFVCVWGSTLPLVAGHAPAFAAHRDRFLSPTIHFRDGIEVVKRELHEAVAPLGVSRARSDEAVDKAYQTQRAFRRSIVEAGERAVQAIRESGEKAIILVGRPYNVFDRTINLSVATKLASIYGINVIPMHFLDIEGVDISGVNRNMYWNYGRKILQTAVRLAREPQFDLIYITNFKCGPDSFIKRYVRDALGRPFLVLQFDGHSNDAGMMTRCEAYLDSKGFLAIRGEANRGEI